MGGLGLLSKFDRVTKLMGVIANKRPVLEELRKRDAKAPDMRYGGYLGDVPFWER